MRKGENKMQIITLEFENWKTVLLRFNWIAIILIIIITFAIYWGIRYLINFMGRKSITIDEFELGVGSNKIKIKCNRKDQEIAYKLWVELHTRKIGLKYDEENDVIVEVYNSWYQFFRIARELLKEVPPNRLPYCKKLIILTSKILNIGLRPHLTKWQAKFRKWYENALVANKDVSPQELQREYPYYEQLVEELMETNKCMIKYTELMREIAFKETNE